MRKMLFLKLFFGSFLASMVFTACSKDDDSPAPVVVPDQSYTEEFDSKTAAEAKGFIFLNTSENANTDWAERVGDPDWYFAPKSGTNYVGADYLSTAGGADIISNWIISPKVTFQNGDKISFYTRAVQYPTTGGDSTDYANRLQVRLNLYNDSTNVGEADGVGDFTTPILDINPFYVSSSTLTPFANQYPSNWKLVEATVYGLTKPVTGRYAIRYYIEGGGSAGYGSGVAVDGLKYTSVTP